MADRPKAHRRLVPRVPKKEKERPAAPKGRADSEITVQRQAVPADAEPFELMDRTEVRKSRPSLAPEDLEITVRRTAAPPAPEDVIVDSLDFDEHDVAETVAIPSSPLARVSAPPIERPPSRPSPPSIERPPPRPSPPPSIERPPARPSLPPRESFVLGADEPEPPVRFAAASQLEIRPPEQQAGLPFGLDAASARFVPAGSQLEGDPDPDAFADLEPTSLKVGSSFAEDRPTTHISPAERGLLAAISEGHEASRLVYMNWLERRGEKQRAEFLRLDHALAAMDPRDVRFADAAARLRALAQNISVDWRSRVARSRIEGCPEGDGPCPGYWRALPSEADDVRQCGVCNQQVFYCVSIDLARSRVHAGQRVAVDIAAERMQDDLLQHCTRCRSQVPHGNRFCPHCGHSMTGYQG